MSRLKWCIALATGWLLAGCAGTPEELADAGAVSDLEQAASTSAAEANAATASASAETVAAVASASPVPVVDAAQLAPSPNEGLVCREILKPNSNVIVTACGTPEDWKKYERREAQNAAEITRMMQGSAFR